MKKLSAFMVTIIAIITLFNLSEARAQTSKKVSPKESDKEFEEIKKEIEANLSADSTFNAYMNAAGEFAKAQLKVVSNLLAVNKENNKLLSLKENSASDKEVKEQLEIVKKALNTSEDSKKELKIAETKFNLATKSYEASHKE